MKLIQKALFLGLLLACADVLLMLPLPFPNKNTALLGAFFGRFAIGFLVPLLSLSIPSWQKGLLVGVLLSLPDAIITHAFGPIMLTGIVGGVLIGLLSDKIPTKHS